MLRYEVSEFYCMNCGNKGVPCLRRQDHRREAFHRKKLYCVFCKQETQHIEVKNLEEACEFKAAFSEGRFKKENQESLEYLRGGCGNA